MNLVIRKKPTKNAVGLEAVRAMITDPQIRRAAIDAAKPLATLGFRVGGRVGRRKARQRARQMDEAIRTIWALVTTYSPQLVEQLGLVEQPKPPRTAPKVIFGAALGAGAVYLLEPGSGREHRQQLARLVAG